MIGSSLILLCVCVLWCAGFGVHPLIVTLAASLYLWIEFAALKILEGIANDRGQEDAAAVLKIEKSRSIWCASLATAVHAALLLSA